MVLPNFKKFGQIYDIYSAYIYEVSKHAQNVFCAHFIVPGLYLTMMFILIAQCIYGKSLIKSLLNSLFESRFTDNVRQQRETMTQTSSENIKHGVYCPFLSYIVIWVLFENNT